MFFPNQIHEEIRRDSKIDRLIYLLRANSKTHVYNHWKFQTSKIKVSEWMHLGCHSAARIPQAWWITYWMPHEIQSMASRLHCDRAYLTGHPNWTELTLWIPVCSSYLAPSPFDKRASWGVYMLPSLTVGDPNLVSCLEPQVLRDLFLLSFSGMCLIIGMPMTFFMALFKKGKYDDND